VRDLPGDKLPVMVALTGWGRKQDQAATKAAGFDHHLVKPVALDALVALLDGVAESVTGRAGNTSLH
jgi:CheY-like chemotaxis protein